jgi:hypothetical protein
MDNEEAVRKVVKAGKDGVVAPLNVESIEDRIRHFNYIVNVRKLGRHVFDRNELLT